MGAIELSTRSVLDELTKVRLIDLGRRFGVATPARRTKAEHADALVSSGQMNFRGLLQVLRRDELKAVCRAHGVNDNGRARVDLAGRLLDAHGAQDSQPPRPIFNPSVAPRYAPRARDIVQVRHRQYLVESVTPPPEEGHGTLVELVCLDDDHQGRPLQVIWELELGARVLHSEAQPLGEVQGIDAPRRFAAYLHALKWSSVTATDAKLFQSPFRAGIKLMDHQLTPLKKALSLPRANLFIADDVGLGKTIEAGLVLQELLLRQQVDFALIVAPASVCLQWRDEMRTRFGLQFEIYNRNFMARRRQERGFAVNPWATHNRFIISYQTLRRPEYRDPLLQVLGDKAKKSLLILDEAHTAAPATSSKYAIDSRVTRVIRDVAPRFENRLFLSATPHNGHSNSFSALLEILDPQRFTRGVPVEDVSRLDAVMVRRLKQDLRELASLGTVAVSYPERKVVRLELDFDKGWHLSAASEKRKRLAGLQPDEPAELRLAEMLSEYTALMSPKTGRGRLVFVNLQKRLLSSIDAFYRTLQIHAESVERHDLASRAHQAQTAIAYADRSSDGGDEYGVDDEALDAADALATQSATAELSDPSARAKALLKQMLELARQHRARPDGKVLALLDWIERHQCKGLLTDPEDARWTDRRLILFTEYGDSKNYLKRLLQAAIEDTHLGDERIMVFHGGMSDDQREEVQRAFQGSPKQHPVRILICTDAAREGLNLQRHCQDLFHFDVPWNPARMEQRNGRIDRTGQPESEVRCHYFHYRHRKEDIVLRRVVEKVEVIQRELGSLGAVVMEQMDKALQDGITPDAQAAIERADVDQSKRQTSEAELEQLRRLEDDDEPGARLEAMRAQKAALDAKKGKSKPTTATAKKSPRDEKKAQKRLAREIEEAQRILQSSRKLMDFDDELLRDALDVGLELASGKTLEKGDEPGLYRVPDLGDAWMDTLDHLRPPRERDEPFWEWRKRGTLPVGFSPDDGDHEGRVQLHLSHPFVQRVLSRFLSQGYGAHDLHRVSIVPNPKDSVTHVVAFGRLSLFGPGATRLHDQLVPVSAQWYSSGGKDHLKPSKNHAADREVLLHLESILKSAPSLSKVPKTLQDALRRDAGQTYGTLWRHIRDEADALAQAAEGQLSTRGAEESEALRQILTNQRRAIERRLEPIRRTLGQSRQSELPGMERLNKDELAQLDQDAKHMDKRLTAIDEEMKIEPAQIEARYRVHLRRLTPVGLVYLVPSSSLGGAR